MRNVVPDDAPAGAKANRTLVIARDVGDEPYHCRDLELDPCNGYPLGFGHTLG